LPGNSNFDHTDPYQSPLFKALIGPFVYAASNNIFVNLKISFIPKKEAESKLNKLQKYAIRNFVLYYEIKKMSY
jgi:hypothetical protein